MYIPSLCLLHDVMQTLKRISDIVNQAAMWLSILYAFLVTVLVLSSVFLRMAGRAPSWSEEFARWIIIAIAFVSASIALKRGMHIGITVIVRTISNTLLLKVIIEASNILALIFLGYVFWFGLDAAIKAIDQMGDIIPVSIMYAKLHVPFGALLMMIHVLYYTVAVIHSMDPKEFLLSQ